jgi:hypothetical protein
VGTWSALTDTQIPSTEERSLELTAAFEGHGFTLVQGNWDGAGITWGSVEFTLKHGEVGKIILTIFDENPEFVQQSFGVNTEELIQVLKSPKAVQMQFADSISLGTSKVIIKEPWRSRFRAFGEILFQLSSAHAFGRALVGRSCSYRAWPSHASRLRIAVPACPAKAVVETGAVWQDRVSDVTGVDFIRILECLRGTQ